MAVAYLNGKAGVWRTVGGRKIFIANGQSLKDAMKASGKFKNLKDDKVSKTDIKTMDEDDIRAELNSNELKEKNASKEEKRELMLRNHQLRMELDRRWGEDEKKYKEQQAKKEKLNHTKAVLEDAKADWKFAKETYPEDSKQYQAAKKAYQEAVDDYEYAGGKVSAKDKIAKTNTVEDDNYKKAILTDAAADWNYVKDNYPEGSKQYQRAKEAYDRALYDINGKEIQLKGGDKTKYKVLDEATDSMGEKIYKVMEDGQEKWVQGDLFEVKGNPKAMKAGDKILVEDTYTGKYAGGYQIVREATYNDKVGKMNTNMKGYIVRDSLGNEILQSEIRIKKVANMSISELSQRYMEQGYSKETARAMAREDIQNSK